MIVPNIWYENPIAEMIVINPRFALSENNEILLEIFEDENLKQLDAIDPNMRPFLETHPILNVLALAMMSIPSISEYLETMTDIDDKSVSALNEILHKYLDEKIQNQDYDFDLNKGFLDIYFIIRRMIQKWAPTVDYGTVVATFGNVSETLLEYLGNRKIIYFPYPLEAANAMPK